MQTFDLPSYSFKVIDENGKKLIFDEIRKKFVSLTPEEWVRQHFIKYLIIEKKYPASLFTVESSLKLNKMNKRCDAIVYNSCGKPMLIVECKSPDVPLNQAVFDQIARYNMVYKVRYLIVTNGKNHFVCKINFTDSSFVFLEDIPFFNEIK